ncbi:hypothetical protein BFG57_01925 [Bacillus solimangrovi]|uniref:UDP-N-acetylmuramoyl-tripeptide--D-alanyl-D-alanine ligase n=1 Tax=Bacillus solimangrovi TaxID=1305675 RepID=A0A1E5LFM8_9BACI|nr:hypothetical protein BFG57_01925 [Bacillus solimangrovi]
METLGSGGRLPADTQKISPKIISVTGSAGKTTTKSMIASILRERWKVFESANSRNTHVHTREHADLLKESVYQVAVVEYGMSYYKNIEKHCKQLQPSVGVITNVGTAHMGHFNGDVKEVAKAKSELIIGMEPSGVLYVNDDDENSQYLNTEAFQGTIRTIGTNQSCDYIASNIYYSLDGMKFEVTINNKKFPIYIPIYGNHNVYNALFAIAVSYEQGLSIEEIQNGLAKFMKPKRRITVDKLSENVLLIDDCHSSNPNALKAAIDVLENISTFQNVVVLGSMLELGKSSPSIHCEIGEYLVNKKVDYLFTYGRQARMIYNCAISAGFPPERAGHFANHTMLKHELAKRTENTTFLVKGSRKMNMEEIVEFIRELIIQQE